MTKKETSVANAARSKVKRFIFVPRDIEASLSGEDPSTLGLSNCGYRSPTSQMLNL
jgi:hypothetical protein